MNTTIYYTHDNGGRPFCVKINSEAKTIHVYKQNESVESYNIPIHDSTESTDSYKESVNPSDESFYQQSRPNFHNSFYETETDNEDSDHETKGTLGTEIVVGSERSLQGSDEDSEGSDEDSDEELIEMINRLNQQRDEEEEINQEEDYPYLCFSTYFISLFIGEKGSSILIEVPHKPNKNGTNKYIYIGESIFSFTTLSKAIQFKAPIGNSDVVYATLIDEQHNCYCLSEFIICTNQEGRFDDIPNEPYDFFYRNSYISHITNQPKMMGIKRFFCGFDEYHMTYYPNPKYHYERFTSRGEKMVIVSFDYEIKECSLQDYITIQTTFQEKMGFLPLLCTKIVERQY
jgi:hypothetical protein